MEIYENGCPFCGGKVTGEIQSGWFVCWDCCERSPRHMLVVSLLSGGDCPDDEPVDRASVCK